MNHSLSLQERKSFLRKELRQKLAALEAPERVRRSQKILKKLFEHPKFKGAGSLLTYIATEFEVSTRAILEESWKRHKRVYVPRLEPDSNQMIMVEVTDWKELKSGNFGILEPPLDLRRVGDPRNLDLAVIPGLGFDRRGKRYFRQPGDGVSGQGEFHFKRYCGHAAGLLCFYRRGRRHSCFHWRCGLEDIGNAIRHGQ